MSPLRAGGGTCIGQRVVAGSKEVAEEESGEEVEQKG